MVENKHELYMLKSIFRELKGNPFKNPKELILSLIRFSLDEINGNNRTKPRNDYILSAAELIEFICKEKEQYLSFLCCVEAYKYDDFQLSSIRLKLNKLKKKKNYVRGLLSNNEKLILRDRTTTIASEFYLLPEGKYPDLLMIQLNYYFLLQMLEEQSFKNTSFPAFIEYYVDTKHKLVKWEVSGYSNSSSKCFVTLHHLDPLENEMAIMRSKFGFLTKESLKELASASALEKSLTKSTENLSYRGLAMSYFGVIESELRELIMMVKGNEVAKKRQLTWRVICEQISSIKYYLESENIEPDNWYFWVLELKAFNKLRNRCAHGENIEREDLIKIKSFALGEYGMLWWISSYKQKQYLKKRINV